MRLGLPLVVLLLAACSPGGDSLPTYGDQANAACAQTQRALASIPAPTSSAQFTEFIEATNRENHRGLDKLAAVIPPDRLTAAHNDLVGSARDAIEALEAVQRAKSARNVEAEAKATKSLTDARDRYNVIASKLGLDRCVSSAPQPNAS